MSEACTQLRNFHAALTANSAAIISVIFNPSTVKTSQNEPMTTVEHLQGCVFFFFLMYLICHLKTAARTANIVNIISARAHNL